MNPLALIKIGGSLITDKTKPFTVREDMMRIVADSVHIAYEKFPENAFILANGAGSFGHYLASKEAGENPQERIDAVHESVVLLNRLFVQHLVERGLPAISVVPAEHISAKNGALKNFNADEVEDILSINSIPVLFGDIVSDGTKKGMIFSTEALFEIISDKFRSDHDISVIYAGETDGVLDANGATIPVISSVVWKKMGRAVEAPKGYDVTGGMTHKIESALYLAKFAKNVRIISGKDPEAIADALADKTIGTQVLA